MRTLMIVCIASLAAGWLCPALPAIPQTMSYQGVLRDAAGDVVPDGDYDVTFRLYAAPTGGFVTWEETQTLSAEDGIVNATLGSLVPITVPFASTRWLGISVEGQVELVPRTELTPAPYAHHAAVADEAPADLDWNISGSSIYRLIGNVGVGVTNPSERLDVDGTVKMTGFVMEPTAVYGYVLTSDAAGVGRWRPAAALPDADWTIALDDVYKETGRVGIGNASPSEKLDVTGTVRTTQLDVTGLATAAQLDVTGTTTSTQLDVAGMTETDGFRLTALPAPGDVLTSDASGTGSWQPPAAVPDGDWTVSGDDVYRTVGRVGLHTSTPANELDVVGAVSIAGSSETPVPSLEVSSPLAGDVPNVVRLTRSSGLCSGNNMLGIDLPSGGAPDSWFIECSQSRSVEFGVDVDGFVYAGGGIESDGDGMVSGKLTVDNTSLVTSGAGSFECDYLLEGPEGVVTVRYNGSGDVEVTGAYVQCTPAQGHGTAGYFVGGGLGVWGLAWPSGESDYVIGVAGSAPDGLGTNVGLTGGASGAGTNYGVRGSASSGTVNYAGYFSGDVEVTGTLTKGGGAFKIDHPLDPDGKYLMHSFVESPDMMNVYNGNVVLGADGAAWVELPEWFEALNRDFRYQLTCIGAFAPVYIEEKIAGNRFRIAGGEPDMEVSWLVTGVRHDAYAEANRIPVEKEKSGDEYGKYMHPELRGMPREMGAHYVEMPSPAGGE